MTYPGFALACRVTQSATQPPPKKLEETKLCPVMIDFSDFDNWLVETPFFQFLTT